MSWSLPVIVCQELQLQIVLQARECKLLTKIFEMIMATYVRPCVTLIKFIPNIKFIAKICRILSKEVLKKT